jgi:hypothetical protein
MKDICLVSVLSHNVHAVEVEAVVGEEAIVVEGVDSAVVERYGVSKGVKCLQFLFRIKTF